MDSTVIISEDSNKIMNKPEPFKKTGLGERLKSAREAMQLTEKEAAARLHLSATIIALLENENFAAGPPTTFIRGYLRAYAKLLNLSENEIILTLKNLESSISSSSSIVPVIQMKTKEYNERYLHWLTYVIGLVLIVLVSVWWRSHSRYVIADVPSAQAAVNTKPATTPVTPAEPNPASATATTVTSAQPSPFLLQNVPAPAIPATSAMQSPTLSTATQSPTASTTIQSTKKSPISNLGMALPEPDIDTNQDENNND